MPICYPITTNCILYDDYKHGILLYLNTDIFRQFRKHMGFVIQNSKLSNDDVFIFIGKGVYPKESTVECQSQLGWY